MPKKRDKKLLAVDVQQYINIQKDINSEKDCFRQAIRFIEHIKKNYNFNQIRLSDFVFDSSGSEFFMDDSKHVVRIYLDLCIMIVGRFVGKERVDELYHEFITYCRKLMVLFKKNDFSDENGFEHISNYAMFLLYILSAAKAKNDITEFIRTYRKLITFIDTHKPIPIFPWFDDEYTERDHFKKLGKLLSTAKFLKESGIQIFGNDPKLIDTFLSALNFSTDDEPCLIIGETGTGKEIIAKLIHAFSKRKNNKFHGVNIAGFTETMFDSDIQGTITGYATGVGTNLGAFLNASSMVASAKKIGYYVNKSGQQILFNDINGKPEPNPSDEQLEAVGGTLLLDEINSLKIGLQSKLLRIIQEKEVQVQGDNQPKKFHVKLLCASNSDLKKKIQKGTFREDLYHRINRGVIELPPLRKMKNSMSDIVEFYIKKLSIKLGIEKKVSINKSAVEKLKTHSWPGNHRELENTLYRAIKNMILDNKFNIKKAYIEEFENVSTRKRQFDFSGIKYHELAKNYFDFLHNEAHGNQKIVAERAGLTRMEMRTRLKKYGIT